MPHQLAPRHVARCQRSSARRVCQRVHVDSGVQLAAPALRREAYRKWRDGLFTIKVSMKAADFIAPDHRAAALLTRNWRQETCLS
jgi:hypothetical protein